MRLFCSYCQKYVNAQTFQRFWDVKEQIITDEYYCPECLQTIYIKKSDTEE